MAFEKWERGPVPFVGVAALTLGILGSSPILALCADDPEVVRAKVEQILVGARRSLLHEDWLRAIPDLQKADKAAKGANAECLELLARAYYKTRAFHDGASAARRLVALNPSPEVRARAHNLLGLNLQENGRAKPEELEQAEGAFRRALELADVEDPAVQLNLAVILLRTGRRDEGLEILRTISVEDAPPPLAARVRDILDNPSCAESDCAPPYRLTTEDGRLLTREDLRGKVVVLLVGYAYCPGCSTEKLHPTMEHLARQMTTEPLFACVIPGRRHRSAPPADPDAKGPTVPRCVDGPIASDFGLSDQHYPAQVVIDHESRVVWVGGTQGVRQRLAAAEQIDAALKRARKAAVLAQPAKGE